MAAPRAPRVSRARWVRRPRLPRLARGAAPGAARSARQEGVRLETWSATVVEVLEKVSKLILRTKGL
jgi:hypothetical protein